MTQDDVLKMFKDRGALLSGHFKLTSGLHSDSYLQCALLLQYGCDGDRLGAEVGSAHQETGVGKAGDGGRDAGHRRHRDGICHRAGAGCARYFCGTGGRPVCLCAADSALAPGEEVIVAEDVITTGGSVREVAKLVESNGAHVAGFAALAERGESRRNFPAPKYVLLRLPLVTYPPDQCPLCDQGLPLIKPGSRPAGSLRK